MSQRPRRRWVVVPGWGALAVYVFACLAIVADGVPDQPIDYRHVVVTAWWMLVFGSIGIMVALALFLAFARNVQPVSARFAAVVVVGGLVGQVRYQLMSGSVARTVRRCSAGGRLTVRR